MSVEATAGLSPLGQLHGTHRATALGWLFSGLVAFPAAAACAYFATHGRTAGSPRLWVGALVLAGVGVWMLREFLQLRRLRVERYDGGLVIARGAHRQQLGWGDVVSVDAEYVPGATKQGTADPGNLVNLLLTFGGGSTALPKELEGFRALAEAIRAHTAARWRTVLIKNLMHRS
ncbi:MAG: hypothetical protein K1X89_12915 [Myxococcaceae bacterium]|nr:hypothetical protein [Myxococcaceae bacterium]